MNSSCACWCFFSSSSQSFARSIGLVSSGGENSCSAGSRWNRLRYFSTLYRFVRFFVPTRESRSRRNAVKGLKSKSRSSGFLNRLLSVKRSTVFCGRRFQLGHGVGELFSSSPQG